MRMKMVRLAATGATLVVAASLMTVGCQKEAPQTAAASAPKVDPIAHGKYLVEQVAMCGDCHTPRLPTGEPDMKNWLKGADLDFDPKMPLPGWVKHSPSIAGLPTGWTEDNMVRFLATGEKPGGMKAGPPMPPVRMNADDAKAVTAYLVSLGK